MDPRLSAQNVVRCVLCQTHETPLHCEFCQMNLCKDCVEKHLADPSKDHKVMSFKQYCTTLNNHATSTKVPMSSFTDWSLLGVPRVITSFTTMSTNLTSLTCLNGSEVWVLGGDSIMRLFSDQGGLVKSVRTKSKENPCGIAVTMSGELVYADYRERTVNIMRYNEIQSVISLSGWKPRNISSTSSGDLLVVICCDDFLQTKVVRYSAFKEKQTIQYKDEGKPLYSSGWTKFIAENKNLDICVSDRDGHAVVEVNQTGKFLFNYAYAVRPNMKPFTPTGITTDSQSRILTADSNNNCIHIIHQKGHLLGLIDNCHLRSPWGISVDTRDNLLVAENDTSIVKKIEYCK